MRHVRNRALCGTLFAAAAMFIGSALKADIIPVFNVATPLGGGTREFSYNVSIAAGSKVVAGNYFTIYDFNDYVAGSAFAPADWDISIQGVGITPPTQAVTDNPSVPNITFTYTGAAALIGPINPVGGVGAFGAVSPYWVMGAYGQYASHSQKNNPGHADNNTDQENNGFVVTPLTPEASSLMLLLPGLVPLGIMLRRKRLQRRA